MTPPERFEDSENLAIPEVLKDAFVVEPLWVDLRRTVSDKELTLRNPHFRAGIVTIAATLLGRERGELDDEDLRRHQSTLRLAWATALLLAILTILASAAAVLANRERNTAFRANDESQRRLERAYISEGTHELEKGRPDSASVWFAEALRAASGKSDL